MISYCSVFLLERFTLLRVLVPAICSHDFASENNHVCVRFALDWSSSAGVRSHQRWPCVFGRWSWAALLIFGLVAPSIGADWPQAAGPHNDYQTAGQAPYVFSVARDQHVLWRTPLPNTGESTPIVARGRVFLTCHAPMHADAESGREILGMCFDAQTGQELWRRVLPATRLTDMASGFSDNTAASPVSDGRFVCFVNVGGSIRTYDFDGNLVWKYDWVPFGRHHARQQEPILHHGNVIVLKTVAEDLPIEVTTKAGAKPLGRDKQYWTRLHAFDLATGKVQWVAKAGTSVHSASMLNQTVDGRSAILTGRGGGHQPPEEPYGLSLIDAQNGETLWEMPIAGYAAHQNAVWRKDRGAVFVGMKHHIVDIVNGKLEPGIALDANVQLVQRQDQGYVILTDATLQVQKKKKAITYHTNCLVGEYHYFRTHSNFYIGRVHVKSGRVEYLQVPVQVTREGKEESWRWEKAVPNQVRNNEGFVVYQDRRATLNGWGHVSAASPIVVGDYLYMPTMLGTVYVIQWNAPHLNESALVSVSDLGPAGDTWTLSSLTYSDGKLYARTLKELICLGDE